MGLDKIIQNESKEKVGHLLEGVHDYKIQELEYLGKTSDKYVGRTYYNVYYDREGQTYKEIKSPVTGRIYVPT